MNGIEVVKLKKDRRPISKTTHSRARRVTHARFHAIQPEALACEVGHGHTHTGRGGEVGLLRSLSRRATIQEKKWQKAWGTERWGAHGC
jgi:hypothetical protein